MKLLEVQGERAPLTHSWRRHWSSAEPVVDESATNWATCG